MTQATDAMSLMPSRAVVRQYRLAARLHAQSADALRRKGYGKWALDSERLSEGGMRRRVGIRCAKCLLNAIRTVRVFSPSRGAHPRLTKITDAIPLNLCELHAYVVMTESRNRGRLATSCLGTI